MSDDATLNEFIDNSGDSTESGSATEDYQDTGDLQTLETSPIEDWKLVRLDDILSFEYGDNLPANTRQEGSIPVYGSNGQVDTHTEANVDSEGIIIGRKGSIGKGEFSDKPFWAIDTTYYISDEETDENLRFIYYLLQDMELERLNAASAIPGLNRNDAYNLNTLVPPLSEQRKIATVLHTVDQAIQKTDEIIEKLKTIRRGTEQDLLSRGLLENGSLRPEGSIEYKNSWVGEIPEEWDVRPYSELISDSSVGIVVKPTQYYDEEGDVPILRSKDISRDGVVNGKFEYMTQESNKENSNSQLESGDIITVRSGEPGLSCVVSPEFDNANCADLLISRPKEILEPHYAAMWINSRAGRKQIDRFQAGLAQKHFNLGALRKLRVAVPPIEEQRRIIERVSSITELIDIEKNHNLKIEKIKKGLDQDLLSGEVRTTDADIDIPEEVAKYA